MNDEYLWNKQGEDTEISRLEALLSDFKYVPTLAPEITPARTKGWLWRFVPVAAAAAMAVAAAIWAIGVRGPQVAAVNDTPSISPLAEKMPVVTNGQKPTTNAVQADKPQILKAVYRPRPVKFSRKKQIAPMQLPTTLTAEEKHAYQQVLLALYITGSQLKSVNDTIDGIENKRSNNR